MLIAEAKSFYMTEVRLEKSASSYFLVYRDVVTGSQYHLLGTRALNHAGELFGEGCTTPLEDRGPSVLGS